MNILLLRIKEKYDECSEKKHIVNEENVKVAVQLDIETFNRVEEVLEKSF